MSAPSDSEILEFAEALGNFPANGKPPHNDTTTKLILYGLIERQEVNKSCPTCGTLRLDYSFMRLTPAGRCVLAAARRGEPS